jgi:hypothetical protein
MPKNHDLTPPRRKQPETDKPTSPNRVLPDPSGVFPKGPSDAEPLEPPAPDPLPESQPDDRRKPEREKES